MENNASTKKYTYIGFCLGAALPICFGMYSIFIEQPPNVDSWHNGPYACGLGSLAPMFAIGFGAPLFGMVGATIGYVLARMSAPVNRQL